MRQPSPFAAFAAKGNFAQKGMIIKMTVTKDIPYGTDERQKYDLYLPETLRDGYPTVFHFHGGSLTGGARTEHKYIHDLLKLGYVYVDCDYRLLPHVTVDEILKDSASAIAKALTSLPCEKKHGKLFISGDSAGGYIAMMLCFNRKYLADAGVDVQKIDGFVFDDPMSISGFEKIVNDEKFFITDLLEMPECPLYYLDPSVSYPPMLFLTYGKGLHGFPEFTHLSVGTLLRHGFGDRVKLEYFAGYGHCGNFGAPDIDGMVPHAYYTHRFYSSL